MYITDWSINTINVHITLALLTQKCTKSTSLPASSTILESVMTSDSHTLWKTVWLLISWLLKKPADQDLHCFQKGDISGFSRTKVNRLNMDIEKTDIGSQIIEKYLN